MKISEPQLYAAINEYIERAIIPLSANMDLTKQFMFGLKIGVIRRKIEYVVKNYFDKPELKLLEIVDENKLIDLDPIYQSALDAIRQTQSFDLGGITFRESDLQTLYSIIQRHAG